MILPRGDAVSAPPEKLEISTVNAGTEGADVSAIDTVERLAEALDVDDRIGGATHHGSAAVVASYRTGSELAQRLFDQVEYGHTIVDQPVAGQRELLDAFMDRHGLRRP